MPFIGKQSTSNSQITNYTTTVGSGGQTNFTVVIEGGDETHVYLNGVLLKETTDYTVSSTQVSLVSPAVENDIVEIKVFRSFALADAVRATGGTFSGDVTVPNLTLSSNVIKASDGGSSLTLDTSDNLTVAGNLKVKDGGTIGSASDADAITISSSGVVTLSSDFVPATPLSHRNVIINGDMRVAQRATSATGKTTSGIYAVDRMAIGMENIGTYTLAQETLTSGGAYNAGFKKAFRIDCTTADASPASGDSLFFQYKLEGQDLGVFRKGTSQARQFTLQFWVKSNKTGTGQVCLFDNNSRAVGKTYTISSANTWEYKTLTFPADTSGAFNDDNTKGLEIEWALDAGSDFQGGTLPATWGTSSNTFRSINDFALADNTANDWAITGIQLEAGSVATPFEMRFYGEELARCQRYHQNSYRQDAEVSEGGTAKYPSEQPTAEDGKYNTTWSDGNCVGPTFITAMRTQPSMTYKSNLSNNTAKCSVAGSEQTCASGGMSHQHISHLMVGGSHANGQYVFVAWEANAEL